MNRVTMTGKLLNSPQIMMTSDGAKTMRLRLEVAHSNASGDRRVEEYPVRAWHAVADFVSRNINRGDTVMVEGYLNLFKDKTGAQGIEITTQRILRLAAAPADAVGIE